VNAHDLRAFDAGNPIQVFLGKRARTHHTDLHLGLPPVKAQYGSAKIAENGTQVGIKSRPLDDD
jgi:hypothetical protein